MYQVCVNFNAIEILCFTGALSITIEKGLVEIEKDTAVEQTSAESFSKKFAIQLHGAPHVTKSGHKISGLVSFQEAMRFPNIINLFIKQIYFH